MNKCEINKKKKKSALDSNLLTGSLPNTIGKLKNLEVLFLDNNQIEGTIPTEFCGLKKLQKL